MRRRSLEKLSSRSPVHSHAPCGDPDRALQSVMKDIHTEGDECKRSKSYKDCWAFIAPRISQARSWNSGLSESLWSESVFTGGRALLSSSEWTRVLWRELVRDSFDDAGLGCAMVELMEETPHILCG
jgi:hypothetical protein